MDWSSIAIALVVIYDKMDWCVIEISKSAGAAEE
jgi:hypothetical protein